MALALIFVQGIISSDSTAPILSDGSIKVIGPGSIQGTVTTTNDADGTLYYWLTRNATQTAAEIVANGDTQTVTAEGEQTVNWTNIGSGRWYAHFVHTDANSNQSAALDTSPARVTFGGYAPPKRTTLRKKDESILEQVAEIVAALEESPVAPPKRIEQRVQQVQQRARQVVNIEDVQRHTQEARNTLAQVQRLNVAVTDYIKAVQDDEDAAINALLQVI